MVGEVYQIVHEAHEYLLALLVQLVDDLPAEDRRSLDVNVPGLDWYGYPPSLVLEAVESQRQNLFAGNVPHRVLLAPLFLVAGAPQVGDLFAADDARAQSEAGADEALQPDEDVRVTVSAALPALVHLLQFLSPLSRRLRSRSISPRLTRASL